MTNSERINVARQLMENAQVEGLKRKETAEQIKKRHDWIDDMILVNNDKKDDDKAIADCRKWYKEIDGLEKLKDKQGHRVKNLRQAFEDCVMGVGQFNAKQIDFSDIAENWIDNKTKDDPKKKADPIEHVWKQTAVATRGDVKFELFKCINCKVTATMPAEGNEDIKRDPKYANDVFAYCGQEEKQTASGGKKPDPVGEKKE